MYYAMPFAHRVKPWNFNDKVLSFEDGLAATRRSENPRQHQNGDGGTGDQGRFCGAK